MARFTTLCSGSSGNCAVVEENGEFLMVDMGCSRKAACAALSDVGLELCGLRGVLVTHEHVDHVRGLEVFLRRHPAPLAATAPTLDALWSAALVPESARLFEAERELPLFGGFSVSAFPVEHDAAGCCGYRVTAPSGAVMAIATDLGRMTAKVFVNLERASLVALEANYDPEMLRGGPYPPSLKRRIASPVGHLSNAASAAAAAQLAAAGCRRVVFCHLSEENNLPDKVKKAAEAAFYECGISMRGGCEVAIAPRHTPGEWMDF